MGKAWKRGLAAAVLACSGGLWQASAAEPPAGTVVELAGVRFEPEVPLAGKTLQLNGAGIRYKLAFKVYAAGLYLGAKVATPEAVYATPGPRRVHVVMLRDIDGNEFGKLVTTGMQNNASREEFSKLIPGVIKLGEIFAARKRLANGDSFDIDFLPAEGTVISVNGKPMAEPIKEPEFFNALMKIWLGTQPADEQLKSALLGQAPVRFSRDR